VLLNPFERRLVSGGLRRQVLRRWDIRRWTSLGADFTGQTVLEIGCGCGHGVAAAYELLGAKEVHAFDPDPQMVTTARQTLSRHGLFSRRPSVQLWQGEATAIPGGGASYDSVMSFQVLHHVEDWRSAVEEVARVLKPGGSFFLAESLRGFVEHSLWGRWMEHPTKDRFDLASLEAELIKQGFAIQGRRGRGRWMIWLHAKKAK